MAVCVHCFLRHARLISPRFHFIESSPQCQSKRSAVRWMEWAREGLKENIPELACIEGDNCAGKAAQLFNCPYSSQYVSRKPLSLSDRVGWRCFFFVCVSFCWFCSCVVLFCLLFSS